MRALFIGGIKSGKSKNAEEYILKLYNEKPIYLATNEFFDAEMQTRVEKHKEQRGESFLTIEEPLKLYDVISKQNKPVLVECVSMWINNMLYHSHTQEEIFQELEKIATLKNDTLFVINDVSCSVVSDNALVRKFVDLNGLVAHYLAKHCDEVYNTVAGISVKIK